MTRHTDVFFVDAVVHGFHIEENEVGFGGCTARGFVPDRTRCVERGVESLFVTKFEIGFHKFRLHQGFSACASDSSGANEVFVFSHLSHEFFWGHLVFGFGSNVPGVGIVAKLAAHGTPLQEGDKTDARAIYGAHGFERVYASNDGRRCAHDEERE